MSTGAPPPRTSWTPATVLQLRAALELVEQDIAAARGILAGLAEQIPRHADGRAAPISSRRCPSPSATRRRSGSPRWTGTPSACVSSSRACWWASSPAPPGRWRRWAMRASRCRRRSAPSSAWRSRPITWHVARDGLAEAVRLPRPRHRHARQDRHRRHADDGDRVRRGGSPSSQGRGASSHHAAEAQPDLVRADARHRQGGAPARRA